MARKFEAIYRRKAQGKTHPKLGLPDSVRPGDLLTFFVDGACYTREVASVHKGYFITRPMTSPYGEIDKPRRVAWDDTHSAERRIGPEVPATPIEPPLVTSPLQQKPSEKQSSEGVSPHVGKPVDDEHMAKEALDLWSILDSDS